MNAGKPAFLVTANIGCQTHLQGGSAMPVRHWIELIDERLGMLSGAPAEGRRAARG
jgi:glycolate oxidase iron-sulfur subunit